MTFQFEILFPTTLLLSLTLLFLWYGIYIKHKVRDFNLAKHFGFISVFILFLTFCLELTSYSHFSFNNLLDNTHITLSAFNGFFTYSSFSFLINTFTLFLSIIVILICITTEDVCINSSIFEINILRLLIIFSLNLIALSDNLIVIFLLLEIYSLSSYILVGKTSKSSLFSSESAIKYFFIGSVFSIVMVYAIGTIYTLTGLLSISDLQLLLNNSSIQLFEDPEFYFISFLLLCSIFFKLAAAPFHFWAPDVYEGSPTTVMFFLSVVPKITLFYLLIKLSFLFTSIWYIFILTGILSIIIGSVIGVFQTKFKRLLAYSMISNTGLLLVLLPWDFNILVLSYFLTYLFIYSLTLVGIFGIILSNRISYTGLIIKNISNSVNLREINSFKFILFNAFLFTSAGIPPFIGFFIKFFILFSYVENSFYMYGVLAIVLTFLTFSVFYYIRILKLMSFTKKRFWIFYSDNSYLLTFLIIFSFVVILLSTIWFSVLSDFILVLLLQ